VGTKGSFLPEEGSLVPSVIYAEKTEHSKKPEEVYRIIENMYPPPFRYIEIFARGRKRDGWEAFGDELIE